MKSLVRQAIECGMDSVDKLQAEKDHQSSCCTRTKKRGEIKRLRGAGPLGGLAQKARGLI